jgi:hypothetical protein
MTELQDILKELHEIKQELYVMRKTNQRLEDHIDFIETTYQGLYHPIEYVKRFFGKIENQKEYKKISAYSNKPDEH